MPIIDKFKDMGTTVMGKVESGTVREGDSLLLMPNKVFAIELTVFGFFQVSFCLLSYNWDWGFYAHTDTGESYCCDV